jgi:hypothetical protein
VRLPRSGQPITIGRSSQSCDVAVSRKNKLVSRIHAKIIYDPSTQKVTIECTGWNGLTVVIPHYNKVAVETLTANGFPSACGQSEIAVAKGNKVSVEYVAGITVDIRGERALIEVVDNDYNDETEDEVDEVVVISDEEEPLNTPDSSFSKQQVILTTSDAVDSIDVTNATPGVEYNEEHHNMILSFETNLQQPLSDSQTAQNRQESSESTISDFVSAERLTSVVTPQEPTPEVSAVVVTSEESSESTISDFVSAEPLASMVTPEEPTPEISAVVVSSEELVNPMVSATPEGRVESQPRQTDNTDADSHTNVSPESARALSPLDTNQLPRKRKSASPEIEHTKRLNILEAQEGDIDINEEELARMVHVVTNHLAFSRLSSTPNSVLRKSLPALSDLTKHQLGRILQKVSCIGVIHRTGKDAAGKPLEEEYYYMPENDHDRDRRLLVEQARGHGPLRSCRRTHKQYYWKKPPAR